MSGRRRSRAIGAALVLAVLAAGGCQKDAGASSAAPAEAGAAEPLCVETVPVVESVERPVLEIPANVLPNQKLVVFPKVPSLNAPAHGKMFQQGADIILGQVFFVCDRVNCLLCVNTWPSPDLLADFPLCAFGISEFRQINRAQSRDRE